MLNILRKDYGEYVKGFFKISLDIELEEGFSINQMTTEELATFVHEYIHFLQNITTTYGAAYFNDNSSFIQLFVSEAYKCKKKIPFPFLEEKCGIENAYEEMELRSFYLGDSEHKKIHHINEVRVENDEIMESIITNENLELVNIYYDDKKTPYTFGATCIEESMAYLIESEKFSGICRTNELPYNSCELVCKSLCPKLVERKDIIVALAEISLMHFNCGVMFVELLKMIKRENINFKSTNEVAVSLKKYIPHLFEDYKQVFCETAERIDFLYPQNTPFENINDWLKRVLNKGYTYRNQYCNLIARMMDLTKETCKEYFVFLTNEFGFPALCDRNNNIFSTGCDMGLALVPIAIFNEFKSSETQCYLYEYCKAGELPNVNENCIFEHWLQSEKNTLCPFAMFWYHYSLSGKIMEKN